MEAIATGTRSREDVVRESQQMLSEVLETLEANREAIGQEIEAALREQNYIGKCNVCKKETSPSFDLAEDRVPRLRPISCLPEHAPSAADGIIQGRKRTAPSAARR